MRLKTRNWLSMLALCLAVGCESGGTTDGGADMDAMAAMMEQQESASAQQQDDAAATDANRRQSRRSEPGEMEEVTARSPQKGKSLEGGGYLSTVTGTRFWAEHQMILNQIDQALNLFNAEHGRYPKDQDEFMERIIRFNGIQLPELEPGYEYVYDPEEPLVLKMRQMADAGDVGSEE